MISEIRLKGRSLLIGAVPLFSLTLAVCLLLTFSLSLMSLVYRSALLPAVDNYFGNYASYINLFAAAAILLSAVMAYIVLKTGSDRYMLKRAENVHAGTKDIFYYFSPRNFFSLLSVSLRLFLIRFSVFVFLNIPTGLCAFLLLSLSRSRFSAAVSAVLAAGCAAFFISSLWFYMRLTSSLFLVRYYFIKGEYLNFRHLTASSQNAMRGNIKSIRRLKLSFFGWFSLCVLILPIGYVWGYYRQTLAARANEIMKLQ